MTTVDVGAGSEITPSHPAENGGPALALNGSGGDHPLVTERIFGRAGIPVDLDELAPDPHRELTATGFDTIDFAVSQVAAGRAVVVVDDEDRENEGDLIFAAELATPELVGFTVRYSSGVICVPLTGPDCDRLELPPMYYVNQDSKGTAYTVSVDAKDNVTTGISAVERARTIRLLADPGTTSDDLTRPGHVFPLRAREGGVLTRPGHTEAGVDLARLAGLHPVAVVCEVVNDDGSMARLPELRVFAR